MRAQLILISQLVLLLLSSCASTTGLEREPEKPGDTKFSAPPLFVQPVETIDVIALVSNGTESGNGLEDRDFVAKLDTILATSSYTVGQRNRIQDRIFAASNVLCERYKVILKRKHSRTNFWLGTAATTAGAWGALAPAESTAQALAALSGLASGVRAEYNQSYFADVATQIITKGINSRRQDIIERVAKERTKGTDVYTMEGALADAVTYHGACSLIAGLEQADSALGKLNTNAGVDALLANPFFRRFPEGTDGVTGDGEDGEQNDSEQIESHDETESQPSAIEDSSVADPAS